MNELYQGKLEQGTMVELTTSKRALVQCDHTFNHFNSYDLVKFYEFFYA